MAVASSIVFHLGLVVVSGWLPEGSDSGGGAKRDPLFTPGAVIPIETTTAVVARAEPVEPTLPLSLPAPDSPATAPTSDDASEDPQPETPRPGAEPPPSPTEAETQPSATAPGLSLHGLRDAARASTAGSKVVVDPSMLQGSRELYEDSIANPGVGSGAVQGPAPPPSSGADYVFSKGKGGKLEYRDPAGRFVATLNADGRVNFRNKGAKGSWTNIGMAGPGDALMAAAGDDPYARLKHKLLKATFEMRLEMAVGFQKKQLNKRLSRLDGELGKIWADERRGLGDRKELIFQRWDECDEPDELAAGELPGFGAIDDATLGSDLDEARQSAATSARRRILEFVRKHAPQGSPEAFTAAEIADMNRRRVSKQKFSPYD